MQLGTEHPTACRATPEAPTDDVHFCMPYLDQQPVSRIDQAIAKLAGLATAQRPLPAPMSPKTPPAVKTPADRREHPRRDGSSMVAISFGMMDVPDSAWRFRSTPHRGHLVDLSMRGCAFHSQLPTPANSEVALRLADDEFDDGRVLRARIIRCDKRLDNQYRIVCRFQENLSLDDLYQFGRHTFSHDIV